MLDFIIMLLSLTGFFFSMWKAGQWVWKYIEEDDDEDS